MIELHTLGRAELRVRDETGRARTLPAGPEALALLAYLAVERPPSLRSLESVADLLWPELAPEAARAALEETVGAIDALVPDLLVREGSRIGVDESALQCDATAFEEALAAGREEDALAVYGGDFLPGFPATAAASWRRWVEGTRARLRGRAGRVARDLARRAAEREERAGATLWARRSLEIERTAESELRSVLALAASDRPARGPSGGDRRRTGRVFRSLAALGGLAGAAALALVLLRGPDPGGTAGGGTRGAGGAPGVSAPRKGPSGQGGRRVASEEGAEAEPLALDPTADEEAVLAGRSVEELDAYELYILSRMLGGRGRLEEALDLMNRAVERDPDFALAHAWLAHGHATAVIEYGEPYSHLEAGVAAARRAVSLDPEVAIGWIALGYNLELAGRFAGADSAFARALTLEPALARDYAGESLVMQGRCDEAVPLLRAAIAESPGEPRPFMPLALAYACLNMDDEAERAVQRAYELLALHPYYLLADFAMVHLELLRAEPGRARSRAETIRARGDRQYLGTLGLADAALVSGDLVEARRGYELLLRRNPEMRHPWTYRSVGLSLAHIQMLTGEAEAAELLLSRAEEWARRALDEGNAHPGVPLELAAIHAVRGQTAPALVWLRRAADAGWPWYRLTARDPVFAGLREEEEWENTLARMERRAAAMRSAVTP